MINTYFGLDTLGTPQAFLISLLIGLAFGFSLEQGGFGCSRCMAGIFYFRDMRVLKTMFTGLITAMIGLQICMGMGWIHIDQIYLLSTVIGAQIVGGLIFGVGFAMGGWCPGTAAVGVGSGRIDAILFLIGTVLGSIVFNELYSIVEPLYGWGDKGVQFVWENLGLSLPLFTFLFAIGAVICFWGAEGIEKRVTKKIKYLNTPFLKAFSVGILVVALAPAFLTHSGQFGDLQLTATDSSAISENEKGLLAAIEVGEDHIEPEELADRLMRGDSNLVLVDVRTREEFSAFHLPTAVNVPLPELTEYLQPYRNKGTIILYSNGMTHPAQARDALYRTGFRNVYILTDGLQGFFDRCLKPASLRTEPLPQTQSSRIDAWRQFFSPGAPAQGPESIQLTAASGTAGNKRLVETDWLAENLNRPHVRLIDCRSQTAYNTAHIPGSVYLNVESFRGVVGGVSSMLLPPELIVTHVSLMGIRANDHVVFVPTDKMQDATLIALGLERVGHENFSILNGGFEKWQAENETVNTSLPEISATQYLPNSTTDRFTVDYRTVLNHVNNRDAIILDVRPNDYFIGNKSDEARAGHIPGAINRPYTEDVITQDGVTRFKPIDELEKAYAIVLPSKDKRIIVHCRTGHQASQTHFVLKHLLGYTDVLWYDAGWSEWASRPELPVDK